MKTSMQVLEEQYKDQYEKRMAKEIADEIDFEIILGILEQSGWTKVVRGPFVSNKQEADIRCWIDEHATGQVHSRSQYWLFENQKDAMMFILRWS